MKDIKEKPTAHMPRSNATGEIPKAALKKAWTEAKEKSRTMLRESTSTQGDGDYTAAQDTSSVVTDTSYSVIKQNTDFTVQQGRKIARKQAEKYRERHAAEQVETAGQDGDLAMQSSARAVGRICPASEQKKKPLPPRPCRAIFAV